MVTIGTDSHKRTHTVVAVDDVGRRLGELTVAATSAGHFTLVAWAAQWDAVQFALEDCRHLTVDPSAICLELASRWFVCRPG